MYKLFIVDDEQPTREGLRDYFDWSKYGIEVIGEADDGETALDDIVKLEPDIVLTDVKMPNMDGLSLSARLRETLKHIKIIFISGYDDLEYEQVNSVIDEVFAGLSSSTGTDIHYCRNICMQMFFHASRLLMELDINQKEDSWFSEALFKADTVGEMCQVIRKHYSFIRHAISESRNDKSTNVIKRIKEIIFSRFHENITISDIADEIYLTSTYVCLIFKEETGETINDFLTKVRIDKAKELLLNPRNKTYDICYAVGYADPSYFSKQFKKYTGLSPSNYRRRML